MSDTSTATELTAADHFAKGKELLDNAERAIDPVWAASYAQRAQGHFAAANLLLDAEVIRHEPAALGRSGMNDVIDRHRHEVKVF